MSHFEAVGIVADMNIRSRIQYPTVEDVIVGESNVCNDSHRFKMTHTTTVAEYHPK